MPEVRLVAVADANAAFAAETARPFSYERAETGWEALAAATDADAVVVADPLDRAIVEGLLAAGKHVPCEKRLALSVADARAMVGRRGPRGRRPPSTPPATAARPPSPPSATSLPTAASAGPWTSTATAGATMAATPTAR